MIIYNVTVKVNRSVADSWYLWLKQEHVPEMLATGCFTGARIMRLLEAGPADDPTWAIQYQAPDKQHLDRYLNQFADNMRNKALDKWKDRFVAFRTVLQLTDVCESPQP
ncbi:MAG: DUF4286 family protein [Chitinophagaceae bacterium]|nr:DUF4286 family protein [Chitinophagaceae bacterium]